MTRGVLQKKRTHSTAGKLLALCSGISLLLAVLLFLLKQWQPAIGALATHWVLGFLAMQFTRRAKTARRDSGASQQMP